MDRVATKIKYKVSNLDDNLKDNYIKAMKNDTFKKLVKNLHVKEETIIKNTSKLKKTANQLEKCKNCKSILE